MGRASLLFAVAVAVGCVSTAHAQTRASRASATPKLAPAPKLSPNPELSPTPGLEVPSRSSSARDRSTSHRQGTHHHRYRRGRTVFYDPYVDEIVPVAPLPPTATETSPNAGASGSSNQYSVPTYQVPTYTIPKY